MKDYMKEWQKFLDEGGAMDSRRDYKMQFITDDEEALIVLDHIKRWASRPQNEYANIINKVEELEAIFKNIISAKADFKSPTGRTLVLPPDA